jgi:hypothetical protein
VRRRRKSKSELNRLLQEVCRFIHELEPNSKVTVVPHRIYEAGDAHIEVLLPYRQWTRRADKIADAVYKRLWEIEMEHGYDIGVSLRTLDEVRAGAR